MCIVIISTTHPEYPFILINNRDEYLTRPTLLADWWQAPYSFVLGGRDLLRSEQGTWLGITKDGRVAVLTNFRENTEIKPGVRSRGAMVNALLTQAPDTRLSTEGFLETLLEGEEGLKGVGGFSLLCGRIGEPLAVISNRTSNAKATVWIDNDNDGKGRTIGLSNALITDRNWPKVTRGEELLQKAIEEDDARSTTSNNNSDNNNKSSFIETLFSILSEDRLPKRPSSPTTNTANSTTQADWISYVKELRKSIFVPAIGGQGTDHLSPEEIAAAVRNEQVEHQHQQQQPQKQHSTVGSDGLSGIYGTTKQTVILVDRKGHVTYVERTLYNQAAKSVPKNQRDRSFEFDIEGWKS